MSDQKHHIYYLDLASGVSAEDAIKKLSQLPKLTLEKATQLIHSKNRIIKSGLSKDEANRYLSNLKKIGLSVEIRQEPKQSIASAPVSEQLVVLPVPPLATNDDEVRSVPVEFHGQAFEYFKIWIVNIFLTIITLGIYSAWAKVRNKQYFYGNTIIDGSSFSYTAKPISILKGRVIAVGLFAIYSIASELSPMVGLAMMLIFLPIMPWLIIRSLAFNARNSLYRNIRFDFKGNYGEALGTFLLWPLLIIVTAGLILPYIWYKQNRFIIGHSAFGTTDFEYHAGPKDFFRIFLIALGGLLGAGLLVFGLYALLGQETAIMVGGLIMILVYVTLFGYFTASIANLNFNSTTLREHYFTSTLQAKQVAWLYFTNTLAITLSIGLMIPWAQVRMARYRAECLQLEVAGSLDNFIAVEQKNVSALGDQIGEVFDIEMSAI